MDRARSNERIVRLLDSKWLKPGAMSMSAYRRARLGHTASSVDLPISDYRVVSTALKLADTRCRSLLFLGTFYTHRAPCSLRQVPNGGGCRVEGAVRADPRTTGAAHAAMRRGIVVDGESLRTFPRSAGQGCYAPRRPNAVARLSPTHSECIGCPFLFLAASQNDSVKSDGENFRHDSADEPFNWEISSHRLN